MKLINIFKEFKGKPFMQDIPNEFAYLDFKKWAYPRRGKIKQKLQIVLDNNQSDPGTSFFRELTRIWVMWANKNSEEFSIVNPTNVGQKDFGRALAIMMKKDNLIIQKDTNKLLDLIEDYKPSHRAYNVIDKSNNDEIVAKELPRHKALELAKTNKNYMIDATDRLAEDDVDDDDRFHGMDDMFGADLEEGPKDKMFDLAQQLDRLTPEDKEKLKKIQQMIAKEKNEEKISGFDYHYTKGTSGGTQQFGRPRIVNESLKETLKRRAGIIK